jgi:ATP synthase protein I
MNRSSARRRRPDYRRLLLAQALTVAMLGTIALMVEGEDSALSAVTGGLVCLIPNLYFVLRIAPLRGGRRITGFVSAFYRAEAGKFGLTVVLFVLVFLTVPPSNPAFFFGAYVAVHFIHWLAPWLMRESLTP